MHATLPLLQNSDFPAIQRRQLKILQVNLGYLCNQQCLHCHVNAGPNRKEIMTRETINEIIEFIDKSNIHTLDLTGGAPELNPHFRELVEAATELGCQVIDRCNLTVLNEPGQEDLADFLASHRVEVTASLPCYQEDNVDAQRGKGVFDSSIKALQTLNALGYGKTDTDLRLNLVYNPQGASLPPPQAGLESDYQKWLHEKYAIVFNQLFTITNMPIKRFGSTLISKGQFQSYMELLKQSSSYENLDSVMCRDLVSIDWQGYVYDCDFNQMLELVRADHGGQPLHINSLLADDLTDEDIIVADHCYACIAGQGSSCGGALNE